MNEQTIVNQIRAYLKTKPDLFFWKEHGGQYGTAGIPDLIICYKGRFIALECKQPGKKPTLLQSLTMKKIMLAGGLVSIVTSLEQAKEIIENL